MSGLSHGLSAGKGQSPEAVPGLVWKMIGIRMKVFVWCVRAVENARNIVRAYSANNFEIDARSQDLFLRLASANLTMMPDESLMIDDGSG